MQKVPKPSLHDRWSLNGRHAIVTGGSKGIGAAIVEEFSGLGANVLCVARGKEDLESFIAGLDPKIKNRVHGLSADVATPDGRAAIFDWVNQNWGCLDILVNNVGTNIRKGMQAYSAEEYDFLMDTNLRSAWEMCRRAYPLLQQSEQGNIINISSIAGLTHVKTGTIYGMTKGAMNQLTRNLSVEWAGEGIRVNAIAPWYIRTPLAEQVLQNDAYRQEVLSRTPMGRVGEPFEVAGLAAYLCMPSSGYVTGQVIAIDGGFGHYGF